MGKAIGFRLCFIYYILRFVLDMLPMKLSICITKAENLDAIFMSKNKLCFKLVYVCKLYILVVIVE